MRAVDGAYAAAMARMPTPKLTRAVAAAVERQAPPKRGQFRPKLRYAHQGGINPPRIIIHGSALDHVPQSYKRYLEGFLRNAFKLQGTPMRVEFRTGRNPYVKTTAKKTTAKKTRRRR
jgi:GTP-binding protein